MTKAVIDGLTYNTETATEIGHVSGGAYDSSFSRWSGTLYRTKKGRYFIDGSGGARSLFSEPYGRNGSQGGAGIRALAPEDALRIAENNFDAETIALHFADHIEDA